MSHFKYFSAIDLKSAYHQIPLQEDDKRFTAFEANSKLYQFRRLPFGLSNAVACFQRVIDEIIAKENLTNTYAYLDDVIIVGKDEEDHEMNLQKFIAVAQKYNITLNHEKCKFKQTAIQYLGYVISENCLKPDPDRFQPLMDMNPPDNMDGLRRCLGIFGYYSKWIRNFSTVVQPLLKSNTFPLSELALQTFEDLKSSIRDSCLKPIDFKNSFTVETDASYNTLAGTLIQSGRPVAFFSRTLSEHEKGWSSYEKEAAAVVESVKKWRHLLSLRKFEIITDQRAVSFIFDNQRCGKTKNDKILRWRLELSEFSYSIKYRKGEDNLSSDAISRLCALGMDRNYLKELHVKLCHPGVRRLLHFVRSKNLPYSAEDVKNICRLCEHCCRLKPRFFKPEPQSLVKATAPFERLSIDFVGPKQSTTNRRYLLTVIDEYSRFPFVYPCADITAKTVISKLKDLFSIFGVPSSIHSDRGAQFMSHEVRNFLSSNGVWQTRTAPYRPQGNGQCERYNGVIWKNICLSLASANLPESQWESVLPDVLHSMRTLLCTVTNCTPHERMFSFSRRTANGNQLPTWLMNSGPVLLRRFVRSSKSDPLVDKVELLEANNSVAWVKYPNGATDTVSVRDLAPLHSVDQAASGSDDTHPQVPEPDEVIPDVEESKDSERSDTDDCVQLRRSTRLRRKPDRFNFDL
jgi:transposase InsO family protein